MTWAKLDDRFTDNPDWLALDRGVRLMHIEAIVWSCCHSTDGAVPRYVLRKVTDEPDATAAAAARVAAELWELTDTGWRIVGFLDNQMSAEEVENRQKLARERQRKRRKYQSGDHSECLPKHCKRAEEEQSP